MKSNSEWIRQEFETINLNDPRLNKRFFKVASELAERPAESIHSASSDWAATKAAYRLFDNEELESSKIMEPHFLSTSVRCNGRKKIIVAQDTSYIDFNKHKRTTGLGKSFKSHGQQVRGICMHAGLAMTEHGLPLGLIYNKLWVRKENKIPEYQRTSLPIQLKESYRWIECLKQSKKYINEAQIVVVSDREGDIYECFEQAYELDVDVVVRQQHDRKLEDDLKISEALSLEKVKGKHSVLIPGNGSRKPVNACLEIRYKKIELSCRPNGQTSHQNRHRENLELYVIDASDVENKLNWRILTTLPIEKLQDAKDILNYYKMRWSVELFFKTLKTGDRKSVV